MNSADFYQQKDIAEMDISGTFEAMSQTTLAFCLAHPWSLTLGKPAAMSSEHSAGAYEKYTWQDTEPSRQRGQGECATLEADDAAGSGLQMTVASVNILVQPHDKPKARTVKLSCSQTTASQKL